MSGILRFEGVTKEYAVGSVFDGSRSVLRALDQVSFAIGPGETVGLVGESGSGKSTIARIATGLMRPSAGQVSLLGDALHGLSASALRDRRAELGFVFQDPYASLNPRQRIGDILALPLRVHRRMSAADRQRRILDLLERVGLTPAADVVRKLPAQLSGGQRQRVAIARAIALAPRLLIADEPVSSLDVSISGQILNLLRDIQREIGSSLLFISHDIGLVQAISDRVLVLHRGRIVESGPTAAVLGRPAHPYALQLMASLPAHMTIEQLAAAEETPGAPVADGCLFRDRCRFAIADCARPPPALQDAPGHHAMCWLLDPANDRPDWRAERHAIALSLADAHATQASPAAA